MHLTFQHWQRREERRKGGERCRQRETEREYKHRGRMRKRSEVSGQCHLFLKTMTHCFLLPTGYRFDLGLKAVYREERSGGNQSRVCRSIQILYLRKNTSTIR